MNADRSIIAESALFRSIDEKNIATMLDCLSAQKKYYVKGEYIFRSGDTSVPLALLLAGEVHIQTEDYWGNRTIVAEVTPGDIFSEAQALLPDIPLSVNAVALLDSAVLFLDTSRVLRTCESGCAFHHTLIQNLTGILAIKNLLLTEKLEQVTQRTTRNKLLAYLSLRAKRAEGDTFDIPFNRQELADYLAVDRSAMSQELSKLKQEGLLDYRKNTFTLY